MNWKSKNLSREIRLSILDIKEPFLKNELYKILGADTSEKRGLVLNVFDELGEEGLIYFEKVLPENKGFSGCAFITYDVYKKMRSEKYSKFPKELEKKPINKINWNSENIVLDVQKEIVKMTEPFLLEDLFKMFDANTKDRRWYIDEALGDLCNSGLVRYEEVLPEDKGIKGLAFITNDAYNVYLRNIYCKDEPKLKKVPKKSR